MLKTLLIRTAGPGAPVGCAGGARRAFNTLRAEQLTSVSPKEEGRPGTREHKIYLDHLGKRISPWHSIPLFPKYDNTTHFYISEIPKGTDAKYEIMKNEKYNPVRQDFKNGELRILKHGKCPFNYGAFPQTWEDPTVVSGVLPSSEGYYRGDNDPLDIIDLTNQTASRGSIYQVKILGVLGLIDEGQMDWKVISMNVNDPLSRNMNDIRDVKKETLEMIHNWFRDYKIVDGKPPNTFVFDGKVREKAFAMRVVDEAHEAWKRLCEKGYEDISTKVVEIPRKLI